MGFYSDQILNIISFDNVILCGKLSLPYGEKDVEKLVIYVNGSGANTFDNKRPGFNYFDLFREQFAKQGVAFFSYNTRGCKLGNNPPMLSLIHIQLDLIRGDIADCDILIVEDIVYSGRTCSYLTNYLLLKGAPVSYTHLDVYKRQGYEDE